MTLRQQFAQDFSADSLQQIADAAISRANWLALEEPKPWKRSAEDNDAIDTLRQLAAYAKRVISLQ